MWIGKCEWVNVTWWIWLGVSDWFITKNGWMGISECEWVKVNGWMKMGECELWMGEWLHPDKWIHPD